jgi:hypothetical protein
MFLIIYIIRGANGESQSLVFTSMIQPRVERNKTKELDA